MEHFRQYSFFNPDSTWPPKANRNTSEAGVPSHLAARDFNLMCKDWAERLYQAILEVEDENLDIVGSDLRDLREEILSAKIQG